MEDDTGQAQIVVSSPRKRDVALRTKATLQLKLARTALVSAGQPYSGDSAVLDCGKCNGHGSGMLVA